MMCDDECERFFAYWVQISAPGETAHHRVERGSHAYVEEVSQSIDSNE